MVRRLILGSALALTLSFLAEGAATQKVDVDGVAAACIRPGERDRSISSLTEQRRLEFLACAVRYGAEYMNSQMMPMRVDDITMLESVEAQGGTTIYHQRFSVGAREITPAIKAELDEAVRANVCGSEQMRRTISWGGAFAYVWVDRSGAFVHRLDIRDC